jgi:hypothetical protein
MLRIIVSLLGITSTVIGGVYTQPVTNGSKMAQTLTESSPGTYLVDVVPSSNIAGIQGRLMRVAGTEIIVDCLGKSSTKVLIKYDGFKTSCRFKVSS